ncbi:heme exporter protein CcmB [Salisediminibacterium beveridgei]|uniref:Heme exporter protein B n=1 Tax=Salisediminibacterium beveridgei TaxID=632773 RepID=A0A1D7QT55_9BACI|nr:heme exporter protein CcmB [Salisediminibacterium beveridgei]AOM82194.1 ABC transporter involved in cytochrome c biogenesis, CcmB subunit [Salisediminibacterium beveridgei]
MNTLFRPALAVFQKDLMTELKSKQMVTTMLIFAGLVIVTFSFAFDPTSEAVRVLIPGMIWVITIFSGILGLNRSFLSEKQNDQLHGMMTAPVDPSGIFLGKFLANLCFVLIVQGFSIPVLFLLFDYSELTLATSGWFILIVFLGTFGFIAAGTLLAALSSHSKSSEMLLPVLLFPLVMPVLIAAVQATSLLFSEGPAAIMSWLQLMTVYNVIFFFAGFLLFDYVLEV